MGLFDVFYKKKNIDRVKADDEDDAIEEVVRNLDEWDAEEVNMDEYCMTCGSKEPNHDKWIKDDGKLFCSGKCNDEYRG